MNDPGLEAGNAASPAAIAWRDRTIMWRSFFLALGIFGCILGAESLVIDKAVLKSKGEGSAIGSMTSSKKEIAPAEWMPWSLLSVGAVTILYSFTLPRRKE